MILTDRRFSCRERGVLEKRKVGKSVCERETGIRKRVGAKWGKYVPGFFSILS